MTVEQLLKKHFKIDGKITIRAGDIVDVDGDVKLKETNRIEKLPVRFGTITGDFICHSNRLTIQLTTLQGAPHTVGGSFYCTNHHLTTLQGAPRSVDGSFSCHGNQLTSLEGAPQSIGGEFDCSYNQLTTLQGAPRSVGSEFICTYNQLRSLEGAPHSVGGYFDCTYNHLTTLQGAPLSVSGSFYCNNNPLTSLDGVPQSVKGRFGLSYNENLGLLKLIINNIEDILLIKGAPEIVEDIMYRYREKADAAATPEQRNALAVQCAAELIRAGYRNNARL